VTYRRRKKFDLNTMVSFDETCSDRSMMSRAGVGRTHKFPNKINIYLLAYNKIASQHSCAAFRRLGERLVSACDARK
jgi:hypothetical protein